MSLSPVTVASSRPTTVPVPEPWICVIDGVQFTARIHQSTWSTPA